MKYYHNRCTKEGLNSVTPHVGANSVFCSLSSCNFCAAHRGQSDCWIRRRYGAWGGMPDSPWTHSQLFNRRVVDQPSYFACSSDTGASRFWHVVLAGKLSVLHIRIHMNSSVEDLHTLDVAQRTVSKYTGWNGHAVLFDSFALYLFHAKKNHRPFSIWYNNY